MSHLVNELVRDIMPISIVTKFGDDWISLVKLESGQSQYRQISPIKGP